MEDNEPKLCISNNIVLSLLMLKNIPFHLEVTPSGRIAAFLPKSQDVLDVLNQYKNDVLVPVRTYGAQRHVLRLRIRALRRGEHDPSL